MTIDPGRGWRTERLALEPLTRAHAGELFAGLDDPALHEFIGGEPLSLEALTERYAQLESRASGDGSEVWGNWVLRELRSGEACGFVQATLPAAGPGAGPASIAWVVVRRAQGRGYASEAARSLVARLLDDGWTVVADVHPEHAASKGVARSAGLLPTGQIVDGEQRWGISRDGGSGGATQT